jgi:competence protein ComEA
MWTLIQAALIAALVVLPSSVSWAQADKPSSPPSMTQLNLNSATLDQLETLPGIGRATAQRILEYRQKTGGFRRIEELMNVKGIGEKSFLKLKPLVVVIARGDKATGQHP